ncbi:MAG: formimidoylglutamase [Bacteroidota bacterium]
MNINDFFDPVGLEKPDDYFKPDENCFSHTIAVHTSNNPVGDLSEFDVALMGVPEDRNSFNKGAAKAPDKIRQKLYQLTGFKKGKKIIDLGNLKKGATPNDTYYGIAEVVAFLQDAGLIVIIMGGTQDNTLGTIMPFQKQDNYPYLLSFDSRLDYKTNEEMTNSSNFLHRIIGNAGSLKLLKYLNLGHQIYLNNPDIIEFFHKQYFDSLRLGLVRMDLPETEPLIRDATIISLDISSVKQGDAPGYFNPSPNGFLSDEICQLARYTGISDSVKIFGLYEVNPDFDVNNQTVHLAAQIIWYFIEGVNNRFDESPTEDKGGFKKFIVGINKMDNKIVFYKSLKSNRWWMEVPSSNNPGDSMTVIACSQKDYELACNNDLPDRWLREMHRLS